MIHSGTNIEPVIVIKTYIDFKFRTHDAFLNNLHQVHSRSQGWKANICFFFKLGASKPIGLNMMAKIDYGHLCLKEENLSFD